MAIILLENFTTLADLTDYGPRNYVEPAPLSFTNTGGRNTSVNGETQWLDAAAGRNGQQALRTPFCQELYDLDDGTNTETVYGNAAGASDLVFPTAQGLGTAGVADGYYYYAAWVKPRWLVGDHVIFGLSDGTNACLAVRLTATGHLYAYPTADTIANCWNNSASTYGNRFMNHFDSDLAGTAYGDTTTVPYTPVTLGEFNLLEVKWRLQDGTATVPGHLTIRVNERTVITFDGDTTRSGTVTSIDRVHLGGYVWAADKSGPVIPGNAGASTVGVSADFHWSDVLVLDDQGTKLNTFPGKYSLPSMKVVDPPVTTSPSGTEGWTYSLTNYNVALDTQGTTYAWNDVVTYPCYCTFDTQDLPASLTGTIPAVVASSWARSTETGGDNFQHKVDSAGATALGSPTALTEGAATKHVQDIMLTYPGTANDWTFADTAGLRLRWDFT